MAYRVEQLTGPQSLGLGFPPPRAGEQGQLVGWKAALYPARFQWPVEGAGMGERKLEPMPAKRYEWAAVVRPEDAPRALLATLRGAEKVLERARMAASARGELV